MNYGFIYCLSNPAMPGIYKIGMSARSPRHRVDELSNATGVAEQFELLFFGDVEDARAYEEMTHAYFDSVRVSGAREFFKEDLLVIFEYFEELCQSVAVTQDGRFHLGREDSWKSFRLASGEQEKIEALRDFAQWEGVKLYQRDGHISTSAPHHFYLSVQLRCAIDSLAPELSRFLPFEQPSSLRLTAVSSGKDF